jgi:hypothetical protein
MTADSNPFTHAFPVACAMRIIEVKGNNRGP